MNLQILIELAFIFQYAKNKPPYFGSFDRKESYAGRLQGSLGYKPQSHRFRIVCHYTNIFQNVERHWVNFRCQKCIILVDQRGM